MKKILLALSAVALVAAGCNQSGETEVRAPKPNTSASTEIEIKGPVTADSVVNHVDASVAAEQGAAQGDDSDLFKSDATLSSFSEVKDVQ
jgi:hypothetical protein